MAPEPLKTRVTAEEARLTPADVVARWDRLDEPGRAAFLNGVRFTEMRGGALLAYLAESVADDADARRNIMRQARDEAKHGYYFSLILDHLGYREAPVAASAALGDVSPEALAGVPEDMRVLGFLLRTEAIELRASVVFEALNHIFADDPFVARYLNEIRYDEMFHLGWIGSRLDAMQEHQPEVAEWREGARDALAAAIRDVEERLEREALARGEPAAHP
jgi:rubrerythrin